MNLSPWPETPAAKANAITRLRDAIAGRALYSDEAASALGEAAAAMIEDYAPNAPQPVRDEAVIRLAGYWAQSDFGGIESDTSVGSASTSYFKPPQSAFRYSGAMGMLSRWRMRRAGAF